MCYRDWIFYKYDKRSNGLVFSFFVVFVLKFQQRFFFKCWVTLGLKWYTYELNNSLNQWNEQNVYTPTSANQTVLKIWRNRCCFAVGFLVCWSSSFSPDRNLPFDSTWNFGSGSNYVTVSVLEVHLFFSNMTICGAAFALKY